MEDIMKNTRLQKGINAICLFALMGLFGYLIINWSHLPTKIPTHYNGSGMIDQWGSKNELWFCPIVSVIIFIFFTAIEKYLITWEIKNENGNIQSYCAAKNMVMITKLILIVAFSYLTINSTLSQSLPSMFTIILLSSVTLVILGGMVQYIYLKRKINGGMEDA